jgi:hypothetical protein
MASRENWHPQTKQDRDAVLLELHRIVASAHFRNSRRYPALLQYIVEATLADRSELLKERTIGIEVFDRPPTYDTNADTVVRFTAGEVRKRLSLYYHDLDHKPAIHISLPVGSYVPEFLHSPDQTGETPLGIGLASVAKPLRHDIEQKPDGTFPPALAEPEVTSARRRWRLPALCALLVVAAAMGFWRYGAAQKPLEDFWAPLLRDHHTILVCSGSVVFKEDRFSGVITADKDIVYPFVSSQTASAIADISRTVDHTGTAMDLQFSASTPLTTLLDQPVILLGGYNNQWTMRLVAPLPFHFAPEPDESIVDTKQPQVQWKRDPSLPYGSADDYALIARFRDVTTGNWTIVLAGLGRNGTEAAAYLVTSPRQMQALRDRIGNDFALRNVEAVLKVNVVDGKTGAPSILAVRTW